MVKYPFLLLDDNSLTSVLSEGTFKIVNLTFDEAKAIMDLHGEDDMICCFSNNSIENILYTYMDIQQKDFQYCSLSRMEIGQDGLIFRLYVTPSETKPTITTEPGYEAKKIENVYVYCQLISRLE